MGNEEKKSVFPREKLKDKLRRLYKKHDRKLLEEYNVVDSDSPETTPSVQNPSNRGASRW